MCFKHVKNAVGVRPNLESRLLDDFSNASQLKNMVKLDFLAVALLINERAIGGKLSTDFQDGHG